jgi:hypothetical protein
MVEVTPGSPLITWRCDRWPIDRPTPLTFLPDHRNAYLEYEGPISGDRGHVMQVETGTYTLTTDAEDDPYRRNLTLFGASREYHLLLLSPPDYPEWRLEPLPLRQDS